MYAIIETGGKQYRVAAGDSIKVEKIEAKQGSAVKFDKVLAVVDEEKSKIGSPYIKNASVIAEATAFGKGDKVIVHKQRPRKVYRKTNGHRQQFIKLTIKEIKAGG